MCASPLQVVLASTLLESSWGGGGGGGGGGGVKYMLHCHSEGQTNIVLACLWGIRGSFKPVWSIRSLCIGLTTWLRYNNNQCSDTKANTHNYTVY